MLYLGDKSTESIVKNLGFLGKHMVYKKATESMNTVVSQQHESRRVGFPVTNLQRGNSKLVVDALIRQEAKKQARLLHRYNSDKFIKSNNKKEVNTTRHKVKIDRREIRSSIFKKIREREMYHGYRGLRLTNREIKRHVRNKIMKRERVVFTRLRRKQKMEKNLKEKILLEDNIQEVDIDNFELENVWTMVANSG
jgi:hypothetical protein